MQAGNWMGGLAVAFGGLALMACTETGLITGETGGEESEAGGDDSAEIVIPDTTRVLAPEARDALVSYDRQSGTLVFSRDSAGVASSSPHHVADPADLAIDDVLVSEPTAAAPHGLLRRVADVSEGPDRIEVLTVEATLGEAIEQGSLEAMLPMDGVQVYSNIPGVPVTVTSGGRQRDVLGYGFEASWEFTLPAGFDFFTGGRCVLTQPSPAKGNARAVLGLEIINSSVTQFGVFGDARSELALNIQCNQSNDNVTFTIAQIISPPITQFIGPVPVVFQFGIALAGGVTSSSTDLAVTAQWSEQYNAGLGWSSGTGWGPYTGHAATPFSWDAKGNGTVRVRSGPIVALSLFSGDVFTLFNWVDIGFGIGATGAVYALPFLEVTGVRDLENGSGSATLFGGLESGGAAGGFVSIDVSTLGFTLFSETWSWIHQQVFAEIKNTLASITY
jgi:hypothetical protein